MKTVKILASTFLVFALFFSCGDDDEVGCNPTYEADIKSIMDKSCAYSGCHSGADAGMFVTAASNDYTNYEGMEVTLFNGSFSTRVLDSLDMPPFYTPDGNPKELTTEELDIISCWIENGYPKS